MGLFGLGRAKMVTADRALPGRSTPVRAPERHHVSGHRIQPPFPEGMGTAVFGMGCFWGAERIFWPTPGVYSTAVGYAGGFTENPAYGGTGLAGGDGPAALLRHVEATAVEVARRHPLDAVLRGAAAEPDPAELLARARRVALAGHARAVDELAERPGFTGHMSLQRVTESMAALLSPETYGLLVVAHGWTVQDWVEWAGRHLVADLFPTGLSGSPGTLHP